MLHVSINRDEHTSYRTGRTPLPGAAGLGVWGAEAAHGGDSLENDVRGALDAGLVAVVLDRNAAHSVVDVRLRFAQ